MNVGIFGGLTMHNRQLAAPPFSVTLLALHVRARAERSGRFR